MRKDIDMSFRMHPLTKDLATKIGSSATRQAFKNLILTEYYKRGFNIEVGSNIRSSLFENMSNLDQQMITDLIAEIVDNFEPNSIKLQDVVVKIEQNNMKIDIFYSEITDAEIKSVSVTL